MSIITDAELIQYLANDYTVAEISDKEKINKRTLESRIAVIKQRLNVRSYAAAVAIYFDKGLIKIKIYD